MNPRDEEPLDGFPTLDDELDEDEHDPVEHGQRLARLSRMAKRMLNRKELAEDTKEILTAVAETSDWAKSEMVRLVAREVRIYLEELRLKEDLRDLALSHSLEVKMSVSLKPLANALDDEAEES